MALDLCYFRESCNQDSSYNRMKKITIEIRSVACGSLKRIGNKISRKFNVLIPYIPRIEQKFNSECYYLTKFFNQIFLETNNITIEVSLINIQSITKFSRKLV